ncbi:MAG: hypothetical protein EA417_07910 [Gammaproteobacteria bacterium]|nr:MAG: hypothetical protein EA417_07910 [Gammaproteobacteria bacterium]
MLHTRPGPRLLALLGVGLVFVFYRPGADPSIVQSVLLPLIGLLAAWYLTGSVVAVTLTIMLLAGAHSDLDGTTTAETLIYPALAVTAGAVLLTTLLLRFRDAMQRRREARKQQKPDGP